MKKASHKKRTLKAARADDDELDDTSLLARVTRTSTDRRRLLTSVATTCARIDQGESSARVDLTQFFSSETKSKPVKHRYANSVRFSISICLDNTDIPPQDKNMLQWVSDGRPQEFLDEMIRLEGRGEAAESGCATCGAPEAVYGCEDCWGTWLECEQCVVNNHSRLPFHRLKVRLPCASIYDILLTIVSSTGTANTSKSRLFSNSDSASNLATTMEAPAQTLFQPQNTFLSSMSTGSRESMPTTVVVLVAYPVAYNFYAQRFFHRPLATRRRGLRYALWKRMKSWRRRASAPCTSTATHCPK